MPDSSLLSRIRAAAAIIAPLAERIEAERRLVPEAVRALTDAGAFKMLVPREYGGEEVGIVPMLEAIEIVAAADGSAGWCAMIGASSGLMSVYVDDSVAREVYGPADAVTCGVFAPMGRAVPEEGGYRVSGRWPFASGCEHSAWRMGGCMVEGGPEPVVRAMLLRAEDTRIVDTWNTSGMRGTGSHDLEVQSAFVPAARSFSLLTDRPRHAGVLYAVPFFGTLAASVAAVAVGIARAAVDALITLARTKPTPGARRSIAHRELVQLDVARAEAKVSAARALLHESAHAAEREAEARGSASLDTRARLRLAAYHATVESAAAVDLAYGAGGASSIYARSPLQRHFRDVHVATQHVMVSPVSATLAARVLLNVESDVSTL
jgi:alkylation response protein AidB-like acyl-CoA dehydrogenase